MADMDKYADEILSDEELDGVAGGNLDQCYCDRDFFRKIYPGKSFMKWNGLIDKPDAFKIRNAYKTFGIDANITDNIQDTSLNRYFIDGTEVSQSEAQAHVTKIAKEKGLI